MMRRRRDLISRGRWTRSLGASLAAALAAAAMTACSNTAGNVPLGFASPDVANATSSVSLKIGAPTPIAPINGQTIANSPPPIFTATSVTGVYTSFSPSYRFRIFDAQGTQVLDSGPVATPSWTATATLTPNQTLTWMARAEYQGGIGPWSATATFKTPNPDYAGPPIGNWQACGSIADPGTLVACVWNAVQPTNSEGDMEVTKRVAWLLRGQGAGLLIKTSGDNIIPWQGFSFSASRICYLQTLELYKIIGDAGPGGANSPGYSDNGPTDPGTCIAALDPSLPR